MVSEKSRSGKATRMRLAATPFTTAAELKKAQHKISMEIWAEMERARQRRELLRLEDYKYITEVFQRGWVTEIGDSRCGLARINADSEGVIHIVVDPELAASADKSKLAGEVIAGLSSSFATIYYQGIGVLPQHPHIETTP